MNKAIISDILRVLTIIANNDGASINELHEVTEIPAEIIKDNLKLISSNPEFYFLDLIQEDDFEEDDKNYNDGKWIIENFDEDVLLNLSMFEGYLFEKIINIESSKGIKIKSTYELHEYKYKLFQMSMAIDNKKVVEVKYKNRNEEVLKFYIEPLALVFYEFDGIFYVVGQYEGQIFTYRLDRILNIKETLDKFNPIKDFDINKYLANIWGMEQGKSVNVKIKFKKEANVEYKVKRDLECRINKTLTDYEDCIIYEDLVIGINNFKSWLRSYGSSAIVMEPEELKQEVIESARKCLNYYL